jgi:flavin-dependent dehydrogenase
VVAESGATCAGRYVIGADGAASAVRRGVPMDQAAWRARLGMGFECFIDRRDPALHAPAHPDLRDDFPSVYAGFIRTGYGWVFPHGDRVAVGLGGLAPGEGRGVRECFGSFLDFLGLSRDWLARSRAHLLPYGNFLADPVHHRVLLAGDAAGLVENLFGEGIYYACAAGSWPAAPRWPDGTGATPGPHTWRGCPGTSIPSSPAP